MATCITFGIQKGGVGKTTTAALSSLALRSFKNFLEELHIRIKP
jgi:cellulose biosynthesis protein BcsQ